MAKRGVGFIILFVIISGVLGAAISQYLSGIFPEGPVKRFFFQAIEIGLERLNLNLGFLRLDFGFTFNLTAFTALFTLFLLYLLLKF
jgi:hypothetical protein|uniref:DUF4321 domain-containing protein n=1 Tax=candidate division WOR-3 bacterium TaxID=2052148 RepID=A0A7C3YRR5_UNCW3